MILKCLCEQGPKGNQNAIEYQDDQYGKSYRVHNQAKGLNNTIAYRCVICGRKRNARE